MKTDKNKNKKYFISSNSETSTEAPLSKEEILKGNALLLRFMDFDEEKSEQWIIKCALYNRSYDELMKVALKIDLFFDKDSLSLNNCSFQYKHMMFHQVMNFNYLYRRTVKFTEEYFNFRNLDKSIG